MDRAREDAVGGRLDRLERESRRWRALGIAAVAVLGLVALLGAKGTRVADEVRARRFVVVDREGRVRAALAVVVKEDVEKGLGLALYDADGNRRASLGVSRDGANVLLKDAGGRTRIALAVGRNGPVLALYDANFKTRAGLAVFDGKGPTLLLNGPNGKPIWRAP
ncbi:MAG: hypothetical protein ACE5IM_02680 [Nitrospinota bacterium]